MTELRFEWDRKKAAENQRKHGVSFEEADEVVRLISARKATRNERDVYDERWHR